jgi:putative glutamine amidotransferase
VSAAVPRSPVIGLCANEAPSAVRDERHPDWPVLDDRTAIRTAYLRGVSAAGGLAIVLSPHDLTSVEPLLDLVDGLLLCGGLDLDASSYGQPNHSANRTGDPAVAEYELTLLDRAVDRGLPILASCRGLQLMNVWAGGSLIQHLEGDQGIAHRGEGQRIPYHPVTAAPGTQTAALLGTTPVTVNSSHHQAVDQLGEGLIVSARAADGLIEGIELPGPDFGVAVQWHPEALYAPLPDVREQTVQARLFSGLIDAAARFASSTRK